MKIARLVLATREPGDILVDEEVAAQLTQYRGPVIRVLRHAGLLRPAPPVQATSVGRAPGTAAGERSCAVTTSGPRAPRTNRATRPALPVRPRPQPSGCSHCYAWAGDRRPVCVHCRVCADQPGRVVDACRRCGRELALKSQLCRFFHLIGTDPDASCRSGDQLWLDGVLAPRLTRRPTSLPVPNFADVVPQSVYALPGQLALFTLPPRDWQRTLSQPAPPLGEDATRLVEAFNQIAREQRWEKRTRLANLRTLRTLLAWHGTDEPIPLADVRAVAALKAHRSGLRVAQFLRAQGLVKENEAEIGMDQAAVHRLAAGVPDAFQAEVEVWIAVLRGQGRRPSPIKDWATVRRYLGYILPVLHEWGTTMCCLGQVDIGDVQASFARCPPETARSALCGLRSLFRALKRERRIFVDPTVCVRLTRDPKVPRPLSADRLRGLIDQAPTVMAKAAVALVAIHALGPQQLRRLRLEDLERSAGRLTVRRSYGDRVVLLDELTVELLDEWLRERHRRWPHSTNPHLLVSRRSAMHADAPPVHRYCLQALFAKTGVGAAQLRIDRLLDEARHTAGPVHLMRVFGVSATTAIKYVQAAHPERFAIDPTQA